MMNYQEFRDEVKKNIGMYLNTSGMENATAILVFLARKEKNEK